MQWYQCYVSSYFTENVSISFVVAAVALWLPRLLWKRPITTRCTASVVLFRSSFFLTCLRLMSVGGQGGEYEGHVCVCVRVCVHVLASVLL